MQDNEIKHLVDELYRARKPGHQFAGDAAVQLTSKEGLAIQLEVMQRFLDEGDTIGGWKVGLTSGKGRDSMGKGLHPFAYIMNSHVLKSGDTIERANLKYIIEPELCLVLDQPLKGNDIDAATAKSVVRGVAPAFEIIELRMPRDAGTGLVLADGLVNWGIVVGTPCRLDSDLLETKVDLYREREQIKKNLTADDMDDPYLSLARLANLLHEFDLGLEPGQAVITGSFCNHMVKSPQTYRATFSGIGEIEVSFT